MAPPILAFPNVADAADVTFSGGAWETTLPLEHLVDGNLAKVARSSGVLTTDTTFDVDLGVARFTRVFALVKHTISRLGTVRIRLSQTAGDFTSPVYDSGWFNAWPIIYPVYTPPCGGGSFIDGRLSAEDAVGYNLNVIHVASAAYYARYVRVEIADTGNPDGYVDLGRLVCASGWQPTNYLDVGARLGWATTTSEQEADGGARYFKVTPRRRTASFAVSNLDTTEAMSAPFEMMRQLGLAGQLFFVFDPDDTAQLFRRSFLATLRQLDPIEFPYAFYHGAAFTLTEVL